MQLFRKSIEAGILIIVGCTVFAGNTVGGLFLRENEAIASAKNW